MWEPWGQQRLHSQAFLNNHFKLVTAARLGVQLKQLHSEFRLEVI